MSFHDPTGFRENRDAGARRLVGLSFVMLLHGAASAADPGSPIDTVIVSASPITSEDKLATIVETVDRDEILRAGGANLADALANTPGVVATGTAAGASRPVIRGMDANRVRVLEGGIGSFDASDVGPDHGVPIDPLSAQRIEVVRGAATLRYGSQAIGGVVNAINNRVPTRLPDEPINAEITGLYGSNADTRQGSVMLDARLGKFALHADGFDRNTDDYDTPEGTLSNSFSRGDGYSLGGSYLFDKNRLGAAVIRYDSEYGIPGEEAVIDMVQAKELMRASFAPGIGAFETLNIEGGHGDYEHSEIDPATGERLATFKDDKWDARTEALFGKLGPFSASAFGVQFQKREFTALGEAADYLLPTATKSSAVFAFADFPVNDSTHVHAGVRVESVDVEGTPANDVPTSRGFTPASGSVGLLFDLSDTLRLGFTLASASRAPAQTELFARGPHEGHGTFETGDAALDAERADSLEATIRYDTETVHFEGAIWAAEFDDYVFGSLTGRNCDEEGICAFDSEGDLQELFYLQQGASFWGAEGKATFELLQAAGGTLRVTALADYVRARLDEGGNVPRISPYHVGAGLEFNGPAYGSGVRVKYTGRQDDVGFAETETPGFVSLDAEASWRPLRDRMSFELALIGRNLTDETQRNAVAFNKDEVLMPGRDVRLMIRANL